jgi:RNA 2',3'-cyclic 3'-phosphodiesterase
VRLFVALELPSAVRDNFAALMNELRTLGQGASPRAPRWVPVENLHVTLKFIGTIAPKQLDEIRTALSAVRSELPVELSIRGLGFFPNANRPRVVWAGVTGSHNLGSIAGDIDRGLAKLGVPSEQREFIPHLTLARCERVTISPELRSAIEKNAARDFGELRTNEFRLIESKLKPSRAEYTTLQSFMFAAEA